MSFLKWDSAASLPPLSYACAHCGNQMVSNLGFETATDSLIRTTHRIYLCCLCCRPTYVQADGSQSPAPPYGQPVKYLPSLEVEALYNEARKGFAAGVYTATVLCCRKLLMALAVSKGAPAELDFLDCLEYLNGNAYIPPDAQAWVQAIVARGREAAHEIDLMSRHDAETLLVFVEALLRFVYEFPGMLQQRKPQLDRP